MPEANPERLLRIPSGTEGSEAFRTRVAQLLSAEGTHLYIDTSFLMWMTKLGSASRQEFIAWLKKNCAGRSHVPIWAAHEYLKHHVAGTIVTELTEKTNEVADLVGRTYSYFRPFIDEAQGEGAEDSSTLRAATRAALNALDRLAATTRQWHKSYQKHAGEVIDLINELTPASTTVYDELRDIIQDGAGRFVGSVPPGFRDRRKKGSDEDGEGPGPADSNRYGDLVFWKEVLAHARTSKVRSIIVLTNDRKNDWHLGRSETVEIDPALLALRKNWKPVPRPHPMLVLEAKLVANIDQLELLDSPYLAALLRDLAEDEVRAFADVAIIPDGPEPESEAERRAKLLDERQAAEANRVAVRLAEAGHLFADQPEVQNSKAKLSRALYESREAVSERAEALLETWRAGVEAKRPLSETLGVDTFEGFDHTELVRLGRELHDRVLAEVPGYAEAVVDLVSTLDRLPPNSAAAVYLGLLASMYLHRTTNVARLPPSSPVAQLLFERQSAQYAANGVLAVAKRLRDNDFGPLYAPSVDQPKLATKFDIEPDTPEIDQLRSLKICGVELLTPAQADAALKLDALFEARPVTGDAILRKACELYGLPEGQVVEADQFGNAFALTTTVGFKRPADISIPKEGLLGE